MRESFTPGALRALERAQALAARRAAPLVEPIDLIRALAEESESRAANLLTEYGLPPDRQVVVLGLEPPDPDGVTEASWDAVPNSAEVRLLLSEATELARSVERGREVGTEHLLAAVLAAPGPIAEQVEAGGLRRLDLIERLGEQASIETAPLPLAPDLGPLLLATPGEAVDLARILDASANRAREGLRVVEDYVRFVLDDPMLTRRLKDCRHRLGEASKALDLDGQLIASRDTRGDVGTHIMTASEQARESPRAVVTANFKRACEALRTLEEYSKLSDVWLSGRFEVLRYDLYTLEKLVLTAMTARNALDDARLYVLVGGLPTLGDLVWVVGEALAGGAQVIQLREKGLSDREVLTRAREVRILTAKARARFILNDRPDLARLAGADGVHLGQDDILPRDARRVLGPTALLGVSTHQPDQLERAVLDGAGYLGVGPVFASGTKDFSDFAGLEYVRLAAERTTLPWYAIGGIDATNLDAVLEAGATRVAVSGAVVRAERPRQAAADLRARLDAVAAGPTRDD